MSTALNNFEQRVYDLTERLLEEHCSTLDDLELRADFRGIKVLDPSPECGNAAEAAARRMDSHRRLA